MKKTGAPYFAMRLAYEGASFSGFQWQKTASSIQQEIERVAKEFFKFSGRIHFLSRTDAGVNAWDQVVLIPDFESCLRAVPQQKRAALLPALNAHLKPEIRVWKWGRVSSSFDFRKDVLWKEYSYFIFNSPVFDPSLGERVFWKRFPIPLVQLKTELGSLLGEHDFSAFAKNSGRALIEKDRSCRRRLIQAQVISRKHPRMERARLIEVRLKGNGFLQHMVRNIVGSAVDHLEGKTPRLKAILQSKRRELGGRAAPPRPLFLRKTQLRPGLWRTP